MENINTEKYIVYRKWNVVDKLFIIYSQDRLVRKDFISARKKLIDCDCGFTINKKYMKDHLNCRAHNLYIAFENICLAYLYYIKKNNICDENGNLINMYDYLFQFLSYFIISFHPPRQLNIIIDNCNKYINNTNTNILEQNMRYIEAENRNFFDYIGEKYIFN